MTTGIDDVRAVMDAAEDVDMSDDLDAPGPGVDPWDDGSMPPAPPVQPDADLPQPPEERCAALPLNDYGNGQRFVIHFGENLIWVPRVGWFTWTGKVWKKDPDEIAIRRYAQQISGLIEKETRYLRLPQDKQALVDGKAVLEERYAELSAVPKADRAPEVVAEMQEINTALTDIATILGQVQDRIGQRLRHAKNAGNSGPIKNMMLEGSVSLAHELEELDASPLEVNTESGVLQFSVVRDDDSGMSPVADVRLLPHERSQLLTKLIPVGYDPRARAPMFEAFLERIQPDGEMRRFLQRWFGLSLTGLTGEQKLVFLYGAGANGKSVLVDLIARILADYSATAKIESLTGKNRRSGGDATPDLVPLIAARMVRASEPEEGERFQEGMVKALTGGEPILVRALQSDFIEVTPVFKLTISGNHKPEIRGTDDGIWRRVLLVPFDVQIPKDQRDPDLGRKLWEERAGILNWMVDGLLAYLEGGLQEPDRVLEATREFREESDPVGAFLEACCVVTADAQHSIPAKELGEAFNWWLADRGEGQWQPMTVARRLKDKAGKWRSPSTGRSFAAHKASTMSYRGIRFNDIFGPRFRDAPRDQQGRPLHGRRADDT